MYKFSPENQKLQDDYTKELFENEIEIYGQKIPLSELKDVKGMTPELFYPLEWLIEDDVEKEVANSNTAQ